MKDAYYFSHDSNAKDDPKCVLLIEQLGMEGYGIYWMLVETLRDQPNYKYPVILIPALARRYNTTAEKVKTVVFNYSLFVIENDEFFFSNSLMNRMERLEDKREKARIAGLASAQKRINGRSTSVQQPFNNRSTSKVNESILNESKEKEIKEQKIKFPEFPEFLEYAKTLKTWQPGFENQLEAKFNQWSEEGWRDGHGNKIKNWKTKIQNTIIYFKNGNNKGFGTPTKRDSAAVIAEADAIIKRAFGH